MSRNSQVFVVMLVAQVTKGKEKQYSIVRKAETVVLVKLWSTSRLYSRHDCRNNNKES